MATAHFPMGWPLFAGHFPGNPVVPAYVLVGLARRVAELALGRAVELERVDRVKLSRVVRPGEDVRCEVAIVGARVRAEWFVAEASVGTSVFAVRS